MIKNLIFTMAIIGSSCFKVIQDDPRQKEEGIINKVIDLVLNKKVCPKSVHRSEQLLSNLDRYLAAQEGVKERDSLSLLINGQWRYLKEDKPFSYSTDWKQLALSDAPNNDNNCSGNKGTKDEIRFSTAKFSPDGSKAFVMYTKTFKNVQRIMFSSSFKKGTETGYI